MVTSLKGIIHISSVTVFACDIGVKYFVISLDDGIGDSLLKT